MVVSERHLSRRLAFAVLSKGPPPPPELESFNSSVLSTESNKQLRALAKSLALDELRNNELVKDGEGILSVKDVKM